MKVHVVVFLRDGITHTNEFTNQQQAWNHVMQLRIEGKLPYDTLVEVRCKADQ